MNSAGCARTAPGSWPHVPGDVPDLADDAGWLDPWPHYLKFSNTCSIVFRVQAPGTDDHLLSQIADICRWYAAGGPPTAQRQAAALAELAQITAGRTDLLARYAGQSLARHDTGPEAAVRERAAQLCITAGADMSLIERWSRESRPHRATRTSQRPHQQ
jgi:hypothetical protein